jgi:hypothetical protein
MAIMLQVPERARVPFCSGIIQMTGACFRAGPFFMAPANTWQICHEATVFGHGILLRKAAGSRRTTVSSKEARAMAAPTPTSPPEIRSARATGIPRKRVVSRLWRTAERQVAEIETRMSRLTEDPLALERDAKTLAIIARTIRDLVAIDGEASDLATRLKSKEQAAHGARNTQPETGEDTFGPRDIEGFRSELARRLDELRCERAGGATS